MLHGVEARGSYIVPVIVALLDSHISAGYCGNGAAFARYRSQRLAAASLVDSDYWVDFAHHLVRGDGTAKSIRGLTAGTH